MTEKVSGIDLLTVRLADYDMVPTIHNDTYPAISPLNSDLSSRAVFISGATRGLGKAMAISFAQAGASKIAIASRGDASETVETMRAAAREAGRVEPHVLALRLSVDQADHVDAAAQEIKEKFGRMDIVINNAGVLAARGSSIVDTDPEEWMSNFEINMKGPYLIMRAFIPLLLSTPNGLKTVATVSSVGAHCITPGMSGYQTSKLAVLRLTEFAQAEYRDQGLLTYCIHPGNIPTAMLGGEPEGILKPIFVETAELSADSLVFLTRERREWLGGRYVNVTWDLPELMAKEDEIVNKDMLKVRLVV